jgi:hypothetical protein
MIFLADAPAENNLAAFYFEQGEWARAANFGGAAQPRSPGAPSAACLMSAKPCRE